jgi:vacuolar-type H+-ATPase subunit E/Vma4
MKTEGHAKMHTRHALLAKKQEMITEVYAEVATALCALPSKEMEALLSLCLKSSHVTEGVIRPAKGQEKHFEKLLEKGFILGNSIESKGGFLLETPQKDFNFTFSMHLALDELEYYKNSFSLKQILNVS